MIRQVEVSDKKILIEIAQKYLTRLYSPQDDKITEWVTGTAFKQAWVFEQDDNIAGLLVLKNNPNKDYVKISTLIVPKDYRGLGVGSSLLKKAVEYTKQSGKNNLSVTVSEGLENMISFLRDNDFEIIDELTDKYIKGKTEYVFLRQVQ